MQGITDSMARPSQRRTQGGAGLAGGLAAACRVDGMRAQLTMAAMVCVMVVRASRLAGKEAERGDQRP